MRPGEAGDLYNVEVQVKPQSFFPERSLYYWAKTYADQLPEGKEYRKLNKVIGVNVLDFSLLPEHIPYHSCFLLKEKDRPEQVLTLDLILHYLEIPKLKGYIKTDLAKWLYYLRHAGEEDDVMEVLLKEDSCFYAADARYKEFMANEEARLAYQARSMYLHDEASRLCDAREEGELKKARETAKKLKTMGLTHEQIADATGLSKEEIEKL